MISQYARTKLMVFVTAICLILAMVAPASAKTPAALDITLSTGSEVTVNALPVEPLYKADLEVSNEFTPVVFITEAQSNLLVYNTFTLAANIFGAMISIIAMGAGIALGFRIAREVRGFLSGGG